MEPDSWISKAGVWGVAFRGKGWGVGVYLGLGLGFGVP